MAPLPADTHVGAVHLRVADLARQVGFYQEVLGLRVLAETGGVTDLGATDRGPALVRLEDAPGAPPPPSRSSGLFHMAFLLPTRAALGAALHRLHERGWPLQGFADHAVSEAVYLADPERNGIELYADRPRETWERSGGELRMVTEPLDVNSVLAEASPPGEWIAEGTVMGHVHLKVPTLEEAEAFYVGRLGFDVVTRAYPGALFVSAGGYHHHVGLNVWSGVGAPAAPEGSRGLVGIEVVVPDAGARSRLLEGSDEDELAAPGGVRVRVVSSPGRS